MDDCSYHPLDSQESLFIGAFDELNLLFQLDSLDPISLKHFVPNFLIHEDFFLVKAFY